MKIYIIILTILLILLIFYILCGNKIENYTVNDSINDISNLYNQGNMTIDNLDVKSNLTVGNNFIAKNDLNIEDDLTVKKNVTVDGNLIVKGLNSRIPTGTIVVWWSGSPPNGWVYCDGTNGTPKLDFYEEVQASGLFSFSAPKGLSNKYIMKK